MTNKIDFGFGWDPSQEFGFSELEATTTQQTEQQISNHTHSKAGYLEMQQAVQNKETQKLRELISLHGNYLTPSRWKTLGRLAVKNFSSEIVSVLNKCNWENIFSPDLTLWCVTNDQEKAFDFAVTTFVSAAKNNMESIKVKNAYNLLMGVTSSNYILYDKYRAKLFQALSAPQKDEMAQNLLRNLSSITPKNAAAFKSLFKELSSAKWESVFQAYSPYQHWSSAGDAFGLALLLHEQPHLAAQLSKAEKIQRLKTKRMEIIACNSIFKIGLHQQILSPMRMGDVFQAEFCAFVTKKTNNSILRTQTLDYLTPYMLLHSDHYATRNFKDMLRDFCQHKQIPFAIKQSSGVERLIQYSNDFIRDLIKSPEHKDILNGLLEQVENAYAIAARITSMDKKDALYFLPHLSFACNNSGLTLAHSIATHIAISARGSGENRHIHLLEAPELDWEASSVSGETAKEYLIKMHPENKAFYEQIFQQRQAKILHHTAHRTRADNNLNAAASPQRKM